MFFRKKRTPADFRAEIDAHLQIEIDRLREQGLSESDARAEAGRAFGNRTQAEERFYHSARGVWWDLLLQNVRFGVRMLARTPGSTVVAILTLALGIGANTAVFSLLNAVLLRTLPVRQPHELVLFGKGRWRGSNDDLPDKSWQLFSYPFYREFRRKNHVFSDVAAIDSIPFDTHGRVGGARDAEKIGVELVSGTYFETLGVNPAIGRTLNDSDDLTPGAHPVAVASYAWWQRREAGDARVVGTTISIGSTVYTIIGVAAPEFFGTTVGQAPDLWIPLAMEKQISPGWNGLEDRFFQSLYIIARRKPGVAMAQAQAETNVLFKQILHDYVGPQPTAKQNESIRRARIDLTSAATGLSQLRRQFSSPLQILMVVVVLVLLIACANVANLLLARASARQREMAVRMSIGAGRSRLIRQLLVEAGLLATAGGALGVLCASAACRLLLLMVSAGPQPLPIRVTPDARVLAFTLAVTLLTVLLFGTAPAFRATRLELASALKDGRTTTAGPERNRLARSLVIGQVALSLTLLAGAGLFLRSLTNLMNIDTGFNKHNVLVLTLDPDGVGYTQGLRLDGMMQRVEEHVRSVPGVQAAAFAFFVFSGGGWTDPVSVRGRPANDQSPEAVQNVVGWQYLQAMRMPIVLGRDLNERDDRASRKVAVINETMARIYFPVGSPVGHTFSVGKDPAWQNIEVVGVAKNAKYMTLREDPMPAVFYPHAQHPGLYSNLVVRYTGDAKLVLPAIRRAIADVDPNLPIGDVSTLNQLVDDSVLNQRLVAQLSTIFGILAVLLACIGIYGVMSYGVARRTNELGVRIALGAARADVLWMVLREVIGLLLIGVAAGVTLSAAAGRLVQSAVYGLSAFDPVVIGIAALVMTGVALVAGYLPARRATEIDAMVALRYE